MLFNLAAELLAIKIRKTITIHGIEISNVEVKMSQYADDLTLFLKDEESLTTVFEIFEEFGNVSGLRVNESKTKLMWLGANKMHERTVQNIEAVSKIKILGVWFSATKQCDDINIDPVIEKVKNTTNSWSQRSLTIKGRTVITKSLLISQLVFIALVQKIPNADLKQIESLVMRFMWRGRPPKVARVTLCQQTIDGGLNAIDIAHMYKALKLTWITRMINKPEATWCQLLQARIGGLQLRDLLRCDRAKTYVDKLKIPSFYKDTIIDFQKMMHAPVDSALKARKQLLWYNDEIKRDGKPFCIKQMYSEGIRFIDDIVGHNGHILNLEQLRAIYPQITTSLLRYQGLVCAIPASWKNAIRRRPNESMNMDDKNAFKIRIGQAAIEMTSVKCRDFYAELIDKRAPTAQTKWVEEGYTGIAWTSVYEIPYKCCASTKLQSLQFRVLNRYIPTRKFLCTRNVVGSPLCLTCFEIDTLQHFCL